MCLWRLDLLVPSELLSAQPGGSRQSGACPLRISCTFADAPLCFWRSYLQAIKRFRVNNMVESSALRDMRDASMYDEYTLPKIYRKYSYCVGCAVHSRVVRSRSKKTGARKDRTPPVRARVLERKFGKDNDNRDGNKPSGQASQGQGAAAAPKPVGA